MVNTDSIETESRLNLIQLAANVLSTDLDQNDFSEVSGLIEALCRHRTLPVSTCLGGATNEVLQRLSADEFLDWRSHYLIDPK